MSRRRIDVHHHLLPPRYASWLRALGVDAVGGRELPAWSAEDTLAMAAAANAISRGQAEQNKNEWINGVPRRQTHVQPVCQHDQSNEN